MSNWTACLLCIVCEIFARSNVCNGLLFIDVYDFVLPLVDEHCNDDLLKTSY